MLVIKYIVAAFLGLLLEIIFTRNLISNFTCDLSIEERLQRMQGANFLEWLFYMRFTDVIPKKYFVWYYSLFVSFFVTVISTVILYFLKFDESVIRIPDIIYWSFYFCLIAIQDIIWFITKRNF